jgi:hypothetical protein
LEQKDKQIFHPDKMTGLGGSAFEGIWLAMNLITVVMSTVFGKELVCHRGVVVYFSADDTLFKIHAERGQLRAYARRASSRTKHRGTVVPSFRSSSLAQNR